MHEQRITTASELPGMASRKTTRWEKGLNQSQPYLLMQLQTLKKYKQKKTRHLLKMTILVAEQENQVCASFEFCQKKKK